MGFLFPGPQFSLLSSAGSGIPEPHTLIILASIGNGQTSPSIGTHNVPDAIANITATADSGYYFSHWVVDDLNVGSTNPLNLDVAVQGHRVYAVFQSSTGGPYVLDRLDWTQPIAIYGIPVNVFFATFGFVFIVLGVFKSKQRSDEQL
jgi:hypothetical protein